MDDGAIGRAKSAVPLSHDVEASSVAQVEAAYLQAGLPPAFRLAETEGLAGVRDELVRRGYAPSTPTIMKVGTATGLMSASSYPADILEKPDESWTTTFAGPGF